MQFGLFLKGIGLSLADALVFWRQSFARRTPPEKFDKEYAYTIRHNYGTEGKRVQYSPYGCMKIINSQPGAGDHHGCPFKDQDESGLKTLLRQKALERNQIDDIMSLVGGNHYQVACTRVFQFSHGNVLPDTVGNHPNSYFDASIRYFREKNGGAAPNPNSSQTQTGGAIDVAETEQSTAGGNENEGNASMESETQPTENQMVD